MKTLPRITPNREQLALISQNRLGIEVIRGAAGSGKTTTALLRLRSLLLMINARFSREGIKRPLRVLVLTFNRTLAGYIRALAETETSGTVNVELTIDTFARWAMARLNHPNIINEGARERKIKSLMKGLSLAPNYLVSEIDYLLGRYLPADLEKYLTDERSGRGLQPRVDRQLRRALIDQVVRPYNTWLGSQGALDWNGLAVQMLNVEDSLGYDVIIVDETQDFSANQLRAIKKHMASEFAAVFVIDTVQRIYPRGFNWAETGLLVAPGRTHTLAENHRNTKQIARFAAGILDGIRVEGDGAMPDLHSAKREGALPAVYIGKFRKQVDKALELISGMDLKEKSIAFLAPRSSYLSYLRSRLEKAGLSFSELTREPDWPDDETNVAICTFHSAKGLEFDHVFILGLNAEVTPHEDEEKDDQLLVLRRLLAVAVARARETVTVGYKEGEQSQLVEYFVEGTFVEEVL